MTNKLFGLFLAVIIGISCVTVSYASSLSITQPAENKVNNRKEEQILTNTVNTTKGNTRYTERALIEANDEVDRKIQASGIRVKINDEVIRGNGYVNAGQNNSERTVINAKTVMEGQGITTTSPTRR